ncbi:MAG: ferritin-like domain-containing protein [Limnochordia bacterium]|jgi:rubrerythrin|nr:ferritin-like domain-containing protein [Limnochordia bacterium]MDD2630609.1 ferritin-like domain-containing protein [Limnochordia bacterium]MDD4518086.1 ferritin-like domain-containing protein [Limnochordia bacterium]
MINEEMRISVAPPCNLDQFRADLEESIQDELCDIGFYAGIALEAPTDILRLLTISIVGDEYAHARIQAALLGVNPPPLSTPPACPTPTGDFKEDVETAIAGEISAVARYSMLAQCAPTANIRYLLTSIITDEYGHAKIWSAMLNALS